MVDNVKNNSSKDDDFNFEEDWTTEGDTSSDPFNSDDIDFGSMSSGDSDPFNASDDGEDPFNVSDANSFGGFDEDDDLHAMPTPQSNSDDFETASQEIDDFSDISTDNSFEANNDDFSFEENDNSNSFLNNDGFENTDQLFDVNDSSSSFSGDDNPYDQTFAEEENAFSENENEELQATTPVTNSPSSKGRMIYMAGVAAVALAVGYIGYVNILPMFIGGEVNTAPAPAVALNDTPNNTQFPMALPGQDGGVSLPSEAAPVVAPQVPVAPTINTNSDTAPVLPSSNGLTNAEPVLPPVNGVATQIPPSVELPGINLPELPSGVASVGEEESIEDSITSSNGGIVSMRDNIVNPAVSDGNNHEVMEVVNSLQNRIEALEKDFNDRVKLAVENELSSRNISTNNVSNNALPITSNESNNVSYTSSVSSKPPLKPTIVENFTLKGVSRGMAWVQTGAGVIEVRVGDDLDDLGKVLGINDYNGSWSVSTDKGLILQ